MDELINIKTKQMEKVLVYLYHFKKKTEAKLRAVKTIAEKSVDADILFNRIDSRLDVLQRVINFIETDGKLDG